MAARKGGQVVAVTTFVVEVDGEEQFVRAGDVLPATSPLVKGREELFEPAGAAAK